MQAVCHGFEGAERQREESSPFLRKRAKKLLRLTVFELG
jgi:hypothetical protein